MKFLFALWDGGGAVPPELGVARRLIARGHDVRVIADPTLRDQSFAIGAGFTPWNAAPHRTTGAATEDLVKDWELRNPISMLARIRDRLLAGPAGAMVPTPMRRRSRAAPTTIRPVPGIRRATAAAARRVRAAPQSRLRPMSTPAILRPAALSAIRVARRRARVSGRFALVIQWRQILR